MDARSASMSASACGMNLPTVSMPGLIVAPLRIFQRVLTGTPDSLASSVQRVYDKDSRAARTSAGVGMEGVISPYPIDFGTVVKSFSVGPRLYPLPMADDDAPHPLSALIWINVESLMTRYWGEVNITRLGREAGIAQGGAQRLQNQRKVGPPLLAKVATLFHVEPWQLLAPNLGAGLYRIDDQRQVVPVYSAERRAEPATPRLRAGNASARIITSPHYIGVDRRKKAL
jgi:hypothetical protein